MQEAQQKNESDVRKIHVHCGRPLGQEKSSDCKGPDGNGDQSWPEGGGIRKQPSPVDNECEIEEKKATL